MKSVFEKDFWQVDNLRQTWEYKSVAFLLRVIVVLFIVGYVLVTSALTYQWGMMQWVRAQDAARFPVLLDRSIERDDFSGAQRWISYRPKDELPLHAEAIKARAERLPALFFAIPAQAAQAAGDEEEALFWMSVTRYRLRYDLLRCGNPEVIARIEGATHIFRQIMGVEDPVEALRHQPEKIADLIEKVLAYDAAHPAANSPRSICALAQMGQAGGMAALVPESEWVRLRHFLRLSSADSASRLRAAASAPAESDE